MNQKHILPAQTYLFFQPLFCPKIFPFYLPPSHLPPPFPPTWFCAHSIALSSPKHELLEKEWEQSQCAWSCNGSNALEAGPTNTATPNPRPTSGALKVSSLPAIVVAFFSFFLLQCSKEGDGNNIAIAFFLFYWCNATRRVTTTLLLLPFSCFFTAPLQIATIAMLSLPSSWFFCCNFAKKVTTTLLLSFFLGYSITKKATTMSCRLLLCLCCSEEEEDDSFRPFLRWLYWKKMGTCAFFGGFVVKKVTTTMSSPTSMVVGLWKRQWEQVVFLFFFSPLWFSSLELIINNEMVSVFYVEGCNG